MDTPRSAEEIFADALELEGSARQALIDARCGTDPRLRAEVQSLLRIVDAEPALVEFPNKDAEDEALPASIGRYRVIERCGAGGMGVVYKAEDPSLRRTVAIKVLPGQREISTAGAACLEQEALILATLNHPNIATIYSLEHDGEVPFLVMEFVQGRTLARALEKGPLTGAELERICMSVAAGLGAAHAKGIIHRDLKPANVMIAEDGTVKLLDFGIAKSLTSHPDGDPVGASAVLPRAEHTIGMGTPAYMSPEQRLGRAADRRSDLWAFGTLLQECLAGGARGMPDRTRRKLERLCRWCRREAPDERPASTDAVMREVTGAFAGSALRRSLRPLALGVLAVLLVAGAAAGIRGLAHRRSHPIASRHSEQSVEVRYSDGSSRLLIPPSAVTTPIDSAFVAAKPDGARLVIAWTREENKHGGTLLFWNKRGRLIGEFAATSDNPFGPGGSAGEAAYGGKRFIEVGMQRNTGATIDACEISYYFPSVLRRFDWDGSAVRESYRLYHAGHIGKELYASGFDPGSEWLWLSGRIRDGGALRRIADGVESNTHFVACFDARTTGIEIYPDLDSATTRLGPGVDGEARFGRPILYFVIRGFTVLEDRIDWVSGGKVQIIEVMQEGDNGIAVLLNTTLRFDLRRAGDAGLNVSLSLGSNGQHLMRERARRSGLPVDEVIAAFLGDSVVALADADERLTVTGRFRDVRPALEGLRTGDGRRRGRASGSAS